MWETIFDMAINNGLWAGLFVALMIYVLRDTSKREKKYQALHDENQKIILELSGHLAIVREIKDDVNDLKNEIKRS